MKRMRATTVPGFWDYVDILSRGSTEEWKRLYREAKTDPEIRRTIEDALAFVDPELGEAESLWNILLKAMPECGTDGSSYRRTPKEG